MKRNNSHSRVEKPKKKRLSFTHNVALKNGATCSVYCLRMNDKFSWVTPEEHSEIELELNMLNSYSKRRWNFLKK